MGSRQIIIGCVVTLMLIGLVMVYSNTAVACGVNPLANRFVARHLTWVLLSIAVMMVFAHVDYHDLTRHSRLIMLLTFALLAGVLVLLTACAFGVNHLEHIHRSQARRTADAWR